VAASRDVSEESCAKTGASSGRRQPWSVGYVATVGRNTIRGHRRLSERGTAPGFADVGVVDRPDLPPSKRSSALGASEVERNGPWLRLVQRNGCSGTTKCETPGRPADLTCGQKGRPPRWGLGWWRPGSRVRFAVKAGVPAALRYKNAVQRGPKPHSSRALIRKNCLSRISRTPPHPYLWPISGTFACHTRAKSTVRLERGGWHAAGPEPGAGDMATGSRPGEACDQVTLLRAKPRR
jgi:hypothetical protein